MRKRVALIHAVTVAMPPVSSAFAELWPEAELVNLLDDSLPIDRAKSDDLTPALHKRITTLATYARDLGADGVLFTCSAFGAAIEAAARAATWPVLKPNEAMFEAALERGRKIGMLASFPRSISSMEQEFRELVAARGIEATLRSVCVPEAMPALQRGDAAKHDAMLAEAAPQLADCDAIMLAQFSMSGAAPDVQARVKAPVLTSPASAVRKIRTLLAA
ncbi:MAG TPA: aspartate/glutamate racemase family protein [Hyphomicrobiaceae bacterium]|nr:aspartate/glutamate racemase family protein [Hyphomicrobiaceae bacterium]